MKAIMQRTIIIGIIALGVGCSAPLGGATSVYAVGLPMLEINARDSALWVRGSPGDQIEAHVEGVADLRHPPTLELSVEGGEVAVLEVRYPDALRSPTSIVVTVPTSMGALINAGGDYLDVRGVDSVDIADGRGDLIVGGVVGDVWIEDAGGDIFVSDVGGVVSIRDAGGDIDVTNAGGVEVIEDSSGEVTID
ncbi:MAG: hypothetical protein AAFV53_21410 [Myxococcota bacterium]